MVLDASGSVFIAGSTRSITFPTTPGAYQEDFVGEINGCQIPFGGYYNCDDVFVTKMATDGTGLVYSTYLGGTHVEECNGIAVDSRGCALVVGFTSSSDFPPDGIDFSAEIFVSRLDPSGSVLEYTGTVDSGSANAGHGVAVDSTDAVYFTGAINVPADIYVAKIASSDISVSITSNMAQVPIASIFRFDVRLTNSGGEARSFAAWTAARNLSGGSTVEPLIGPSGFTLQAGETRSYGNVPQFVPSVPLGNYRYYLRAGQTFPGPLMSEDHVDFEVVP
jgi:hypothetical protein